MDIDKREAYIRRLPVNRQTGIVAAIEGVDLTGKTTLARHIAELDGWEYFYTPTKVLRGIRERIESLHDYPSRFFYYLSCVICAQIELHDMLKKGNVVIDRYIDSTFVMHDVLGFDTSCVDRNHLPIIKPDVTIVLTADRDVRRKRFQMRGDEMPPDAAIEQQEETLERAQRQFVELSHAKVIETSHLDTKDVFQEALRILTEEQPCLLHSTSSLSGG